MKTAVVFQGGGALGAFGAGVWSVLQPWLAAQGRELVALAGASIGALNAALIASAPRQQPDVLSSVWRDAIATPSIPFLGWPWGTSETARVLRSWNGLLTGTLFGNRGLYGVQPLGWGPWGVMARLQWPLYQRGPMRALLQRQGLRFRSGPQQPLLALAVTHITSGELRLLHSDEREILPEHLAASAAIPMMFEPVEIDGEPCWDGDMVRSSPLAPLLQLLYSSGRLAQGEPLLLVTVEQFPQAAQRLPGSSREVAYRLMNLLQQGKFAQDLPLPPGVELLRIQRAPLPHDAISGEFDYSPERIDELIGQGEEAARAALRL